MRYLDSNDVLSLLIGIKDANYYHNYYHNHLTDFFKFLPLSFILVSLILPRCTDEGQRNHSVQERVSPSALEEYFVISYT